MKVQSTNANDQVQHTHNVKHRFGRKTLNFFKFLLTVPKPKVSNKDLNKHNAKTDLNPRNKTQDKKPANLKFKNDNKLKKNLPQYQEYTQKVYNKQTTAEESTSFIKKILTEPISDQEISVNTGYGYSPLQLSQNQLPSSILEEQFKNLPQEEQLEFLVANRKTVLDIIIRRQDLHQEQNMDRATRLFSTINTLSTSLTTEQKKLFSNVTTQTDLN